MKKQISLTLIYVFSLVFLASSLCAEEITKSFKGVKDIRIKTVSGDCIVQKGSGDEVIVKLRYTFDSRDFEPEFSQRGSRLELTERFFSHRSSRGESVWMLTVPEQTDIDFSTASGDLEVSDLKSTIEASTASGDVVLSNMTGEFEVSTASGDVDAKKLDGRSKFSTASGDIGLADVSGENHASTASGNIRVSRVEGEVRFSAASGRVSVSGGKGQFELSAASGDVDVRDIVLTGESSFSVASGDVEVGLAQSPEHDIKLSSASGDAMLNFNGNEIRGLVEMTARARRGRIQAPFEFDREETYYKWDDEYVTKTVRKGSDTPHIEISTASGKATLRDK